MEQRLLQIVNRIKNNDLRRKVHSILDQPKIRIAGRTYTGLPIEKSPASMRHHHNYPGGFVEHTLSLYTLCTTLSRIVRSVYRCHVDQDLVICGVLLHDIFKPATYEEKAEGGYKRSSLAERMDHLTLASAELIRRGFPLDVVHVVTSSHGYQAGPIGPMTIEALIVHLGDYVDAKLNGDVLNAARWMIRDLTGLEPLKLTGKDAFAIIRAKTDKGPEAVKKYVAKNHICG